MVNPGVLTVGLSQSRRSVFVNLAPVVIRHDEVVECVKGGVAGIVEAGGIGRVPLRQAAAGGGEQIDLPGRGAAVGYIESGVEGIGGVKGQCLKLGVAGIQLGLGGAAQRNLSRLTHSGKEQIERRFGIRKR